MEPEDPGKARDDMANLMRILESGESGEKPVNQSAQQTGGSEAASWDPTSTPAGVTGQDVDWMKNIMERFEGNAEETSERLAEETQHNRQLSEALETERTNTGARVGSWEISQKILENDSKKQKKLYDVTHTHTGEPIAKDLMVYEAAHALVKLLNKGYTVTDSKVNEVLTLEEHFSRAYSDAAQYKYKAKRSYHRGDDDKGHLYESRFDSSRTNALKAKDQLKKILARI